MEKIIVVILIFASFLWGCEEDIQYKIPHPQPALVLNSLAFPDSAWHVEISHIVPLNHPIPINHSNTIVFINEDSYLSYPLTPNEEGIYTSQNHFPKDNHTYKIVAEEIGFPSIHAEAVFPPQCEGSGVIHTTNDSGTEIQKLILNLNKPDSQPTFYNIKRIILHYTDSAITDTLIPDKTYNADFEFDINSQGVYFSNIIPDQYNLMIILDLTYFSSIYYAETEIYSISEALFYYQQALSNQNAFSDDIINTIHQIPTNIKNGYGIFGTNRGTIITATNENTPS